jgi:hypothetical protein
LDQIVWVQDSAFGTFVRESSWALFAALIAHTIGMGFLAGAGMAVAARTLGTATRVPAAALAGLAPLVVAALALAAASGVVLVIGYPAKALTNPLFYAKLAIVALALWLTWRLMRRGEGGRGAALLVIVLWAAAIAAGRFLAYTHKMLLAYPP